MAQADRCGRDETGKTHQLLETCGPGVTYEILGNIFGKWNHEVDSDSVFMSYNFGSRCFSFIIFFLITFDVFLGLPKQGENYAYYNEQEYTDDYDYGDDDSNVNDADGALDDLLITHRPVIISKSSQLDVDNGMTIRLPCFVDKLPGDIVLILSIVTINFRRDFYNLEQG